jgi:hypothetical protein
VLVISAVFSMFGKGGGSLYTPVLLLLGWAVSTAISTSLFLNLVTALAATVVFARNKLVDFKFASIFLPGTIVGSLRGAFLQVPVNVLLGLFAIFLVFAGARMILSGREHTKEDEKNAQKKSAGIKGVTVVVIFSFLVGVLSSLLGVGGGIIIFPFLVLYLQYPAQKSAGANSFIVTVSSIVGSIGHGIVSHLEYLLLGTTIIAAIIGATVGSIVTVKASPSFVKVAFGLILWFFAVELTLNLLGII